MASASASARAAVTGAFGAGAAFIAAGGVATSISGGTCAMIGLGGGFAGGTAGLATTAIAKGSISAGNLAAGALKAGVSGPAGAIGGPAGRAISVLATILGGKLKTEVDK